MTALPEAFLTVPVAHRGLHDGTPARPENSLAAVRAAVAAGYGIEIDLQRSSDGVPMVFHDAGLARMTGETGRVSARSAADLGALRLIGGAEPVPTLEAVLAEVAGRVPLLVEIKDQDGAMGADVGPLEKATARLLAGYDGPVAVMSFNPHAVAALAEAAPQVPRGLTTCAFEPEIRPDLPAAVRETLRAIPDYDRVDASFLSHRWSDLARPRVAELRAAGAALLCWTIRRPEEEAIARRIAQNITFEGYAAPQPA